MRHKPIAVAILSLGLSGCWNDVPFQFDLSGKVTAPSPTSGLVQPTGDQSGVTSSAFTAQWSKVQGVDGHLQDVCFANYASGWAVDGDGDGKLLHTGNAGVTWDTQLTSSRALKAVSFGDLKNGLAGGENGNLYRTADGGQHWELVDWDGAGKFDATINAIAMNSATDAILLTSSKLYRTNDGGATWTLVANEGGTQARYYANGVAYFVGTYNVLKRLKDGIITDVSGFGDVRSVPLSFPDPAGSAIGFSAGTSWDSSQLLKTTDGGSTWTPITKLKTASEFVTMYNAKAVAFANPQDGMFVGNYEDWFLTRDGGATWEKHPVPWDNIDLLGPRNDGPYMVLFDINHGYVFIHSNNTTTGGLYRLAP